MINWTEMDLFEGEEGDGQEEAIKHLGIAEDFFCMKWHISLSGQSNVMVANMFVELDYD